jgi:hypothetical protein
MFTNNPFAAVTDFLSPLAMQVYLVLMVLVVVIGTLFDISHKGSAKFFAPRRVRPLASHARKELWLRTASSAGAFLLFAYQELQAQTSGIFK